MTPVYVVLGIAENTDKLGRYERPAVIAFRQRYSECRAAPRHTGAALSMSAAFLAVLVSFVRLGDVFGGDVLPAATANPTSCCFRDFGGFFGRAFTQCFSSVLVRFDILVSGFRKDGFRLVGINCFSCLPSCLAPWSVWISCHV